MLKDTACGISTFCKVEIMQVQKLMPNSISRVLKIIFPCFDGLIFLQVKV